MKDRKRGQIPRIQEITMEWAYDNPLHPKNFGLCVGAIKAPAVTGLEDQPFLTTFSKATAILYGNVGKIQLDFIGHLNVEDIERRSYDDWKRAINKKMRRAREEVKNPWCMIRSTWAGVTEDDNPSHGIELTFSAVSGINFTDTAMKIFLTLLKSFVSKEDAQKPPMPMIQSRTFFQIGEERIPFVKSWVPYPLADEKVPFGTALALDFYADGGWKKIQQAYAQHGSCSALRIYQRLLNSLTNEARLVDNDGAVVMIGQYRTSQRDEPFCSYSLFIDGYFKPIYHDDVIEELSPQKEVLGISLTMKQYGLNEFSIINKRRVIHGHPGKIAKCSLLDQGKLDELISGLAEYGCHQAEEL